MDAASQAHPSLAAEVLARSGSDWLAAVARRHSRRQFGATPVAAAELDAIEAVCSALRPYPDARVVLVRTPTLDVFTGAIGSYGKVRGAPHLLVFLGDERADFADQHVGYTGEAAVLEATRLGLETCWVGGFFDAEKVARLVPLASGERAYAVSPLGHAVPETGLVERAMRGMAGAHKRRTVAEIAPGAGPEWPAWALAAVETARMAPSAVNRQPWRFRLDGDTLVVAKDNSRELPRVTKRLDCGIAMLHAELGAFACDVVGQWTDLSGLDVARFDPSASASR